MRNNQNNANYSEDVIKVTPTLPLLEEIDNHLKSDGFFCLEKSLDLNTLSIFQNEILSLINSKGKRYFSLIDPCKNIESKFNLLENSYNLKKFLFELAKSATDKDISDSEVLNVLRVVSGKGAEGQSLKFHYDATVITVLIPILIPKGPVKSCGHFLAYKNLRPIRNSVMVNLVEKILIQNPISQKIISFLTLKKMENYLFELKEGNIYFFYGYRTLHANLNVDPNYVRASLLFHFGDPHKNSLLIKSIARIRHWRESLNSK